MGNQTSTGLDPNFVHVRKEVFQNHLQKMQSMEREIQNNKAVILDKNNKIDTLTNTNATLLREKHTVKTRSLHVGGSEVNLQKMQSMEREIQNNKAFILDKNNKIDTLTNTINKLLRENNTLKTRSSLGVSEEVKGRIDSLTRTKEHFEAEYYASKHEKLQLIKSNNEMWNKCEQLGVYIKTLQSQLAECKSVSDTLGKSHQKLSFENSTLKNEKLLLTRSKNEISKKCEELEKYNKTLKNEMLGYKSVSDTLTRTHNDKFLCKNCVSNVENLPLTEPEDEIKKKCEQLEKHNETLKSEVAKFESVPTLKQILKLFENLQVFQRDIKVIETDIFIDGQDLNSMAEKVSNKTEENNKMENELKRKSLSLQYLQEIIQLAVVKEQIVEAENTLQTINLNSSSFVDNKQQTMSSLTEKVEMCVKELEKEFGNISDSINKIEEQMIDHKKEFAVLQNKGDQVKKEEQEELYKKILTLLDKQYNILWLLLYIPDDADDNISNISESDSVLLSTDGKKHYAVMLYNLKEGPGDQQKVIDIITSICSIPTKEIKVQRLGPYNGNRVRPIKVYVPTFLSVTMILSNKWKLKKSEYPHINIGTFDKKRGGKVKGKQVRKEKSATFAYHN